MSDRQDASEFTKAANDALLDELRFNYKQDFEDAERVTSLPFAGTANPDTIKAMSLALLFNYLGVRLNGPGADFEMWFNIIEP
jgi:alkyl sulfatase BDS1-like metallo-beta-lactamase superfamily hydrolase